MSQLDLIATTGRTLPHTRFVKPLSLSEVIDNSIDTIQRFDSLGKIPVVSLSMGKDSFATLVITIEALFRLFISDGIKRKVYACSIDTRLESPEWQRYFYSQVNSIRESKFSEGVEVDVRIAKPRFTENYLLQMIAGRIIASVPGGSSKCQQMLKAEPLKREQARIWKEEGQRLGEKGSNLYVISGSRSQESTARSANMSRRGESHSELTWNVAGGYYSLALLNKWSNSHITEFYSSSIRTHNNSLGFTPFVSLEPTILMYEGMGQSECDPFSKNDSGCSMGDSRSGCWTCQKPADVVDLKNLIANGMDYLKPLYLLNRYIKAAHFDPSLRNWLGRSIDKNGSVNISADSYSFEHCANLLRFVLTIQEDGKRDFQKRLREWEGRVLFWEEKLRDRGVPRPSRPAQIGELISRDEAMLIDTYWNRYGFTDGLVACAIYKDIVDDGARYPVPEEGDYSFVSDRAACSKNHGRITVLHDDLLIGVGLNTPYVGAEPCSIDSMVVLADGTKVMNIGEAQLFGASGICSNEEDPELAMLEELDEAASTAFFWDETTSKYSNQVQPAQQYSSDQKPMRSISLIDMDSSFACSGTLQLLQNDLLRIAKGKGSSWHKMFLYAQAIKPLRGIMSQPELLSAISNINGQKDNNTSISTISNSACLQANLF